MTEVDLNAVSAAVYRFFLGLDQRDNQGVAALMAREGVWHRQGAELVGPQAVLQALEKRDPKRRTAHTVANLWVEAATPQTARVRYYLIAYETTVDAQGRESEPKMLGVRESTDDLILEDGAWRVRRKHSRRFLPAE
ncbi:MAG TPA: nuclear transport factor 2 family protein [Bordetella sp.]